MKYQPGGGQHEKAKREKKRVARYSLSDDTISNLLQVCVLPECRTGYRKALIFEPGRTCSMLQFYQHSRKTYSVSIYSNFFSLFWCSSLSFSSGIKFLRPYWHNYQRRWLLTICAKEMRKWAVLNEMLDCWRSNVHLCIARVFLSKCIAAFHLSFSCDRWNLYILYIFYRTGHI